MTRKFFTALIFTLALMTCAYAAESETGDKVLARVGSQDITERDVLEFIQPFGPQALQMYANEQGRKMIIDDVITMRLFAIDGEANGIDKTPEFIAALENAKRAMLAQAAMRKEMTGIAVSEEEAKKFYDENPKLFVQPERVHASHILVSGDEMLAKVQEELKVKSFDVVAKEYSQDPGSAVNGGDLGEFTKGQMVPEFEKAAFELKNPGDVSEPVKSQFGWHIIKLEEHIPESKVAYENVKQQIIQELRERKTQEVLQNKAKELESKYKVERF